MMKSAVEIVWLKKFKSFYSEIARTRRINSFHSGPARIRRYVETRRVFLQLSLNWTDARATRVDAGAYSYLIAV